DHEPGFVGEAQRVHRALHQQPLNRFGQVGRYGDLPLQASCERFALDRFGHSIAFRSDPDAAAGKASRQIGYDLTVRSFDEADELLRRLLLARDDAGPQRSMTLRHRLFCDLCPNRHSFSVHSQTWLASRARSGFAGCGLVDLLGLQLLSRLEVFWSDPTKDHTRRHDHVLGFFAADVEDFEDALVAHRLAVLVLLALGPADEIVSCAVGKILERLNAVLAQGDHHRGRHTGHLREIVGYAQLPTLRVAFLLDPIEVLAGAGLDLL